MGGRGAWLWWEGEAEGRPGCWGEGGQWLRTKGVRAMDGATWVEAVGLYALPAPFGRSAIGTDTRHDVQGLCT